MYNILLVLHSFFRWMVLFGIALAMVRAYRGLLWKQPFGKMDNRVRSISAAIAHIQLVLGLCLYFVSPLITYFLHNFKVAVHQRGIRFFGMEHSLMMFIAITLLTIGSAKAKRKKDDADKHKQMAIWYTIALLLILSSIPWAFSPLVARPWLRGF